MGDAATHGRSMSAVVAGPAVEAAPALLGATIRHDAGDGPVAVRIVEVEAYHQDDPASHTFPGRTERNAAMFAAGGHLYVYRSYGIHLCANIVCGPVGRGEAVLLRGGVVVEGRDRAVLRRGGARDDDGWLAAGPGRLGQVLGLALAQTGAWLLGDGPVTLEPGTQVAARDIACGRRIGITRAIEQPWRWWLPDTPGVSGR